MDYPTITNPATATSLNKYQWDAIHNPGWHLGWFDKEEDAAMLFDPTIHEEILKEAFKQAGKNYDKSIVHPILWGVGYGADGISIACDAQKWWEEPFNLDLDNVPQMLKDYFNNKINSYIEKAKKAYDFVTDENERNKIIQEEVDGIKNDVDNVVRTVESMSNYAEASFKIKSVSFIDPKSANYNPLTDPDFEYTFPSYMTLLEIPGLDKTKKWENKTAVCIITVKKTNEKFYVYDYETLNKFVYLVGEYRKRYPVFDNTKFAEYARNLEKQNTLPQNENYFEVDVMFENIGQPNEKYLYLEYRNPTGRPSISVSVVDPKYVKLSTQKAENHDLMKRDEKPEALYLTLTCDGLEYVIDFLCDEQSFDVHFDNKKNLGEVNTAWQEVNSRINAIGTLTVKNAFTYGVALHNLMDFYSHSNYVEMYLEYWKNDLKRDIKTFTLNDIPIWDDAVTGGFGKSKWYQQVRTGDFDLGNMFGGKKSNTHHDSMNKDNEDGSPKGKEMICKECELNYFLVAKKAAIKHTAKILKK
jgi:hypothetical protein